MRLIDADELKESLRGIFKDVMGNFVFNTTFAQLESIIDTAPTVSIDNTGYSQGFKDGKECTLVSIDAIEDITDRMVSIISEIDWEKAIEAYNARPQGEWLEDSGNIACSHCRTIWLYRRADFCPHCGADMRGKEND